MHDSFGDRLAALEEFQEKYQPLIDKMISDDQIDKAVNAAIKKHNRVYLTWTQRIGGAVVVGLSVAQALHDIFG